MWNEYFALLVMAALLRASYELSRPKPGNPTKKDVDLNTPGLTPQQKEWSEKAVKKYAEVQERKWHRWNEAMFEKV